MRYYYEFFTEITLKDGFTILPYNMGALYLRDGTGLEVQFGVVVLEAAM
jgi:hypothetical protein